MGIGLKSQKKITIIKLYSDSNPGKEDSKIQTCVLPQSNLQSLCDQSRTHFEPSLPGFK